MILSDEEIIKHATEVFPESILNELLSDSDHPTHQLSDFVDSIERALIAKASQQVQGEAVQDATGRSPQDYAIEHAEYLATSAEQLLNHLNECTDIEDGVIEPDENYSDYTSGLRLSIHDFRKRRDRAKAMPAPKQEPVGITDSEGNLKIYKERLPANTAIYAVPPQAAAIPEWENEAKRAFWCGFELGASFRSCSILPRWNEYISKRKSDLSAAPKPGGE